VKLVRSRTPQLFPRHQYEEIDDARLYNHFLAVKLVEEAQEVVDANQYKHAPEKLLDELADVYEVLTTIGKHHGFSLNEIQTRAVGKRFERGSFDLPVYLTEFEDGYR
jgi:predicted house-cleaning noncanonical NTP pyrophosphatase (MazG superfamily)